MGQFRVVITGTGNHGCQRERTDGQEVEGCGLPGCVDCWMRHVVAGLSNCATVKSAQLVHWPDTREEVTDDLVTRLRTGSFPEAP